MEPVSTVPIKAKHNKNWVKRGEIPIRLLQFYISVRFIFSQQNESIANSYRQAQEKLAQEVDRARGGGGANYPESQGGSHYHHPTNGNSSNAATPSSHGRIFHF